jgi:subtilase family serine protease
MARRFRIGAIWRAIQNMSSPLGSSYKEQSKNIVIERLEARTLLTIDYGAFAPRDIRNYYGLNDQRWNGAGETIAVVVGDNDPGLAEQVDEFSSIFNLPPVPRLAKYNQFGQSGAVGYSDLTEDLEEENAQDVEWAHVVAPQANIDVVEFIDTSGLFNGISNLLNLRDALSVAAQLPGVSVVTTSYGGYGLFDASLLGTESNFETPAGHMGVTFVSGSGDDKAYNLTAFYPASFPDVLAVGGTDLAEVDGIAAGDGIEAGWGYSGGGYSSYSSPLWQSTLAAGGFSNGGTGPAGDGLGTIYRMVPDVAWLAQGGYPDNYNSDGDLPPRMLPHSMLV